MLGGVGGLKGALWGCTWGLFKGSVGGVCGYQGVSKVYFVSETARVELHSGRV